MTRVLLAVVFLLTICCGSAFSEYWGSSASDKYHYRNCWWARMIKKGYLVRFATAEEAFRAGYTPCEKCRPPVTDKQRQPKGRGK